ncbi:PorV/PorQ family protein [candidate division KSB1 bacterium]|nr:PorV/PorQ family protein [candidate division KSB1 bacterium]
MKTKNTHQNRRDIGYLILGIWMLWGLTQNVQSQTRAGLGYLKITPGVRGMGVARTLTGALDYTDAFYANPGSAGFLREWQWSASYSRWITDVYNAALLYGCQWRTPWSRHSRFVLGLNYLGMPEFNSATAATPPASGNNLLVTLGFGQPLDVLTENLSLGANLKYFNSQLGAYSANALIYDVGLLFRTPRVHFLNPQAGFMEYAIFSAGLAITNLGNPIVFDQQATPLPRTVRAGLALNLGSHRGWQWSLATDYQQVRDENGFITIGSELSWSQLLSLRLGYSAEENLLGHLAFGANLRLDDRWLNSVLPGRNNALRFDFASNQSNELFNAPYHGAVTHQPIGPEKFRFLYPLDRARITNEEVWLSWEDTRDPDLYDALIYRLLVTQDSLKMVTLLEAAERAPESFLADLDTNQTLLINEKINQANFLMRELEGGPYYWSALAFDIDNHFRFAEIANQPFAVFQVTRPKLEIMAIKFDYSPWINTDAYQGMLIVSVTNSGERTARNVKVVLHDSLLRAIPAVASESTPAGVKIAEKTIAEVAPGAVATLSFEWQTLNAGYHQISAEITDYAGSRLRDRTPVACQNFYTIPKGTLATGDTVVAVNLKQTSYELPYVGKIFFENQSAVVNQKYVQNWLMAAPLSVFAERIRKNPGLKILLRGTVDRNSEELTDSLAHQRAQAVSDYLVQLGVKPEQMVILPDTVIAVRRIPAKPQDVQWILQENRRVDLFTTRSNEESVFGPFESIYYDQSVIPVEFSVNLTGAVNFQTTTLTFASDELRDSLQVVENSDGKRIETAINWEPDLFSPPDQNNWLEHAVNYAVVVQDSLGRHFKTRPQSVFLKTQTVGREKLYYIIAKFKYAKSFYDFYWSNLLERIPFLLADAGLRMRFVGHGCAIGSDQINQTLSRQRAVQFTENFLKDVKKRYPDLYSKIKTRIDPPKGMGESEPFRYKAPDGSERVIGDNSTPLGRQLNRRVMVHFYAKP